MHPTLAVVSLRSTDVVTCAHFYKDVIGLPLLANHHGYPHFVLGETRLVILQGRPQPALDPLPERFPLVAFAVPDIDAALKRLHAHGVETPWGVESGPNTRWVMFHDPGGNLIELVQFLE